MTPTSKAACVAALVFVPAVINRSEAQIVLNALNLAATQNFDSIGTSSTASLPTGWKMSLAGDTSVSWADGTNHSAVSQAASSNTPINGGRYNWGQTTTDRSIGFMTSGSYGSPNSILANVRNSTGSTIDTLSISFDYERYRINTSAASIAFSYSTDGTNWTAATAGNSGAFSTGASSYGFGTLISSSSHSVTLTSLNLSSGSDIYLRWNFSTIGGNSQGLGLDNFSVTGSAIPEPSTYALALGLGACICAVVARRRKSDKAKGESQHSASGS